MKVDSQLNLTCNLPLKLLRIIFPFVYFILLGYAVFFAPRRRNHHYNYEINFFPVKNSVHDFRELNLNDKKEVFNFYLNLFGNVVLFIPFSIIVMPLFRIDKLKMIILTALVFSTLIEVTQYSFQIGYADIDDVILNTAGAVVGFFLYKKIFFANPYLVKNKI